MAQAKTRTATAPKKAKAPVVCAMCDQEIDDETPLEGPEGMYHAACLKAAVRHATNVKPTGKRVAAPVVDDDEDDEDAEGDEEDLEDEGDEDAELEDEEPVEPSDEDDEDDGEGEDDEDAEEGDEDDEGDEEDVEDDDEDEEPAPKPRRAAAAPVAAKPTPAERMAAARAAKAAKKTAAVEEYDEEDEPVAKPAKKAATGATAKAPAKPKVEVRIPSNMTLTFTDNPARAGTKRWAVLEAMARVPRDAEGQANGPGSVGQIHRIATRIMTAIAKANPNHPALQTEKDLDTKSLNIPWFATDKGKADIFKNGASGWGIRHDEEADTYRIFKRAKAK